MHLAFLLFMAWIGTWASAPVYADDNQSFENDTLRQVVHVSVGGTQVRVRFTNRFGAAPLVIGGASVAQQDEGANAKRGTQRRLTFMGSRTVTIPPNADVLSDPVRLDVVPASNLLVDTYLPDPTGPVTTHPLAEQTNYYAIGDRTGETAGAPFAYSYAKWYLIDAIDVDANARGSVVTFGDSITDGAGGIVGANDRWPDFLAQRLLALAPSQQLGVLNAGISGNRILLTQPAFGENALARLDADVLSQSGVTGAIVYLGVNDIQQSPHQYDPERIELGLQQIVQRLHERGIRAIGATITPYKGWMTYDDRGEATRQAVNAFIRHGTLFDAVVDFDEILRDVRDPQRLSPAYDSGDHLHPNAAAHRAMAAAIDLRTL